MKKPASPPSLYLEKISDKIMAVAFNNNASVYDNDYLHWDELRYKQPRPKGLSAEQWWFAIKLARLSLKPFKLPFTDVKHTPFKFVVPNSLLPKLAYIDRKAGGLIINKDIYEQEQYIIDSLIEESISSSQLEGASTTRKIAKDMLLSQRKPNNESELMILNNYNTMQYIQQNKEKKLSSQFILKIHNLLMQGLITSAGSLRKSDNIHVTDSYNEIVHTPPLAASLKKRIQLISEFANQDETEEKYYIHPIIKAIILHFILAYDHPFEDGNGRTARALFYWFLLNRGYSLIEYISISKIIKKMPVQYGKAFLYTETDDNDVTYFIFHQIKAIIKAIDKLYKYINSETEKVNALSAKLQNRKDLNYRQLAIIKHALKYPTTHYSIEYHRNSHGITYQTARTDLIKLEELKLLKKQKRGRKFIFIAVSNLKSKIKQ